MVAPRGSLSIRCSWVVTSVGVASVPAVAAASTVSSGVVFHRPYDRRAASSYPDSLTATGPNLLVVPSSTR